MPSQQRRTVKSVMSRLQALTMPQRLDVQLLINQGIPPAEARAIAQAYAPVQKAAQAAPSPAYLAAYHQAAKGMLPDWQHALVHAKARAKAGGAASGQARQSPGDRKERLLAEVDQLNARIKAIQTEVSKDSPLASEVHVESASGNILGFRPPKKQLVVKRGQVAKQDPTPELNAAELAYIKAAFGLQVPTESPVPDAQAVPPDIEGLMQSNRLVAGMDAELAAGAQNADQARRRASRALYERPGYYDGVGATPDIRALRGLMLDLGCGLNRQAGYLGVDLAPTDHGTVRADINQGLPFPDGSARAIRLNDSLHAIVDGPTGNGDPIPLLEECQRVLMDGGRLYYTGPEPLFEEDQRWPLPGLVLLPSEGAGPNSQVLQRVPPRVPAYHGADADFSPAGPLPLDLALALAAYNTAPADRAMQDLVLHTPQRGPADLPLPLAKRVNRAIAKKAVPILKAADKQIVYGVVLAPNEIDSQGDYMTPDDIESAAHAYMASSRVIGAEHGRPIEATPVESYIAPMDLRFPGQDEPVKKGSWLMGVKVHDPAEWARVKGGEYTGFSVGGFGTRV